MVAPSVVLSKWRDVPLLVTSVCVGELGQQHQRPDWTFLKCGQRSAAAVDRPTSELIRWHATRYLSCRTSQLESPSIFVVATSAAQSWVISIDDSSKLSRAVVLALACCKDRSWCAFQDSMAYTAWRKVYCMSSRSSSVSGDSATAFPISFRAPLSTSHERHLSSWVWAQSDQKAWFLRSLGA